MANTLAYYDTATITTVKSFIVQAPGSEGKIFIFVNMKSLIFVHGTLCSDQVNNAIGNASV